MAERKARTRSAAAATETKAPAEGAQAQVEFARYKARMQESAGQAGFGSPLAVGAIPAWSLQPPPPIPGRHGGGPAAWGPPGPGAAGPPATVQGFGTTIRLGVDVLNAALSNGLLLLNGVGQTVGVAGWRGGPGSCGCSCGCGDTGDCCDCCGPSAWDCCSMLGCGSATCGCCEPSVGTCC